MGSKRALNSPDLVHLAIGKNKAYRSEKNIYKEFACPRTLRKQLPQTSNLVSKLKKIHKTNLGACSVMQDSGNTARSDWETETLLIANGKRVAVSCKLSSLIIELLSIYPNCRITQDALSSTSEIYKYLYDSKLNQITEISEIMEKPEVFIISSRHRIPENIFVKPTVKLEKVENKSCNMIDMYGSVIGKRTKKPKHLKSPLFILKEVGSQRRLLKSRPLEHRTRDYFDSYKQIFPGSLGRKVQEGTGGFRKSKRMLEKIENSRASLSHSPSRLTENQNKSTLKLGVKEICNIDEICVKYALTRPEFINMLSDFTFFKGTQQCLQVDTLAKAYSVNLNTFKGVGVDNKLKKIISWEEFVKFYVVIVIKKGNYSDLLEFIVKYLGADTENSESIKELLESSDIYTAKLAKIAIAAQDNKDCDMNLTRFLQDSKITLSDLRVITTAIARPT